MLTKFTDMCEMILEDNKSDMKALKDSMIEKFGLKANNFSDQTILPDGTVRMRVVSPNDKQFVDDVFFVDTKSGKYTINGLNKQDVKVNDIEEFFKSITAPTDEPEGEEDEEETEPEGEEEKNGKPELEDEPEEKEEEPAEKEEPEEPEEKEEPEEDEFEDAEKKKKKDDKEDE